MRILAASLAGTICLAVSACDNDPAGAEAGTEAEDFAARINNGNSPELAPNPTGEQNGVQNSSAPVAPTVAAPLPNAAPGAYAAGTATDPAAATCSANRMGPFIGRVADSRTRVDIEDTAGQGAQIRFLRPGGEYVAPDASSPRLNLMLDDQDIIRDARCG